MRGVRRGFAVTPEGRGEVYRRLQHDGGRVGRPTFDAGATLLNRMIEQRLSSLAFGDSAAFRRNVTRDAPLQSALTVLRGARTQADALAHAAAVARAAPTTQTAAVPSRG